MSEADAIRSEIEQARSEMARTLETLSVRMDPRVQSRRLADQIGERAQRAYTQARSAAPDPVRDLLDTVTNAAKPYARRAAADPKRTAAIAGGALAALLVLRRLRRAGT